MSKPLTIRSLALFARAAAICMRAAVHPLAISLFSVLGVAFVWNAENNAKTVPFAVFIVAFSAACLFAATRRPAFSVYCAWALVGTISVASAIKFKMKGFSVHFYDAVVVAGDPDIYRFIFSSYLGLVAPVLVLAGVALAVLALLFRLERAAAVSATARLAPLVVAAAGLPLTYPAEAYAEQRYFYYLQGRHSTAFFVSLLDLANLAGDGALESRLAGAAPAEPFDDTVECGGGKQPDVYVVLEESHTSPAYFPQIEGGKALAGEMAENAGELRPLQVESFGGGTWITNLSLMTGLSATDFGWRSPYLTISLENRVSGALPEIFARCGYRTAAILPLNYTFVNEGPFLSSIGFETVMDMDAIEAPSFHMRDRFYFDAAERFIAEHREADGRPLFLLVQTMFAHSPYDAPLEPGPDGPGEPLHDDPQIAEYLRRMLVANRDYAEFAERRLAEQSERPSVLMAFGDHQVFATKPFVDELEGDGALGRPRSLAYRTFYTLGGTVARPPSPQATVDIAFLGTHLLRAAGLTGSPAFADLDRLNRLCGGSFHACPHRGEIDTHLRRRVEGGLLRLETTAPES